MGSKTVGIERTSQEDMAPKRVHSLFHTAIDSITSNLDRHMIFISVLQTLPPHIKKIILTKITARPSYCKNLQFDSLLETFAYSNLRHINLNEVPVSDLTLKLLQRCDNLRKVILKNRGQQRISSGALQSFLKSTKHLTILDVSNCKEFNDDVIKCLAENCSSIETLYAENCNITDTGIVNLSRCWELRNLNISRTKVGRDGMSKLLNKIGKGIQELRVDNCSNIDDDALEVIVRHCSNIKILTFYCCPITEKSAHLFQDCSTLKQLQWTVMW